LERRIPTAAPANGFGGDISQLIPAVVNAAIGIPHAFDPIEGAALAVEEATQLAFKESYAYAYRIVFYSTIPFGLIAIIAAFFIADASKYMTNHTQVQLEKDILRRGQGNTQEVEKSQA